MDAWVCVGRLHDYPQTIGHLDALLDDHGPHFELDGFLWCAHCERAYPVADLRVVKSGPGWTYYEWSLECATPACDGRRAAWSPWHPLKLPRAVHPEYPDSPQANGHYPLM